MQLKAYLERIGFDGEPVADLATLKRVHLAHVTAIPYENLDIQLGRPMNTDPAGAYDKIVGRRRGGWCYEMNGLLGWALGEVGFKVTRIAASGQDPASHLVLRVDLDEPWGCDVGFGDGPFEPFRLTHGSFEQRGFAFSVEALDGDAWRFHNHPFGVVQHFDALGEDEAGMRACSVHLQTSPSSTLLQNVVAFRHREDSVISLIGRVFRAIRPDGVTRETVESADDYVAMLRDRFALDLPEAATLWPGICRRHDEIFNRPKPEPAPQA